MYKYIETSQGIHDYMFNMKKKKIKMTTQKEYTQENYPKILSVIKFKAVYYTCNTLPPLVSLIIFHWLTYQMLQLF